MIPDELNKIKARCEAENDLCENCNIERPCCTCINAPWQLRALYGCIAEIERLRGLMGPIVSGMEFKYLVKWAKATGVPCDYSQWSDDEWPNKEDELRVAVAEALEGK